MYTQNENKCIQLNLEFAENGFMTCLKKLLTGYSYKNWMHFFFVWVCFTFFLKSTIHYNYAKIHTLQGKLVGESNCFTCYKYIK